MFRTIIHLCLVPLTALCVASALAQSNPTPATDTSGAVSQLILAQRGFELAVETGDPVLLITAIRLARGVVMRPPTAWERVTEGNAAAGQPRGKDGPADPAGAAAIVTARNLVAGDPALLDLVYDLDAQLPQSPKRKAVAQQVALGAGQVDTWRVPFSGAVSAEIGLIGDGDSALSLSVVDEEGSTICALPPGTHPVLCRFLPERNGFYTITVRNVGDVENSYRLLGS